MLYLLKGTLFFTPPLEGNVLKVSGSVVHNLRKLQRGESSDLIPSLEKKLLDKRIIAQDNFPIITPFRREEVFSPTYVTLMPTLNCNLRCTYCYSSGGEDTNEDMSFDVAKASIDMIVKNADKKVKLSFHGGGEPFYTRTFDLVQEGNKIFSTTSSGKWFRA